MIPVVDYGRGNLFSIGRALATLDAPYRISGEPDTVARSEHIILPGVGAFGSAMAALTAKGLVEPLRAAAARGAALLGICVGAQVLLGRGEEFGDHEGLGLVPGAAKRLPEPNGDPGRSTRIPNVGWRRLRIARDHAMMTPAAGGGMVYFVHSYAPMVDDPGHIAATIDINGRQIPAAFCAGNVAGFQFHPEKSGPLGLALIDRFLCLGRTPGC